MASIKRYHQAACMGGDCDCPWRLDYRPQGLAGPRKRIEFPTKKAAEKHLAATATKVARGEYISPEKIPTFAKAGEEWLRDKADRHPATVQGWRVHLKHLVKLDNVRLDRIDVAAVERVRDELRANLGAKTISAVLTTCAAVFKLAQRRGGGEPTTSRGPEHAGCPFQQLRLPLGDLIGMDVKLLRQFRQRQLAPDGGQCHLRLECRGVVPARSSAHVLSCSAAILAAGRQKLQLPCCPDSPGQL
jgi:hypothetical protein